MKANYRCVSLQALFILPVYLRMSTVMSQRRCPDCLVSLIHFNKSTEITLTIKRSHFYSIRLFDWIKILLTRDSHTLYAITRASVRLSLYHTGGRQQESPAIADKPAKACQKLLQFDVLTTLSLTILVYIFIRLAFVASEICEIPRNSLIDWLSMV